MISEIITFKWPVAHFDLDQIAESGQVFRWERRGPEHYAIPAGGHFCVARMDAPGRLAVHCRENLVPFWHYYFGLGDDYPEYWQAINTWAERDGPDAYLTRAAAADGITILHQPAWEAMASKEANCVLLYSMGHLEAFPVDTWIRRVLDREFPDGFTVERYASFGGLVQQIIFYYERERSKKK